MLTEDQIALHCPHRVAHHSPLGQRDDPTKLAIKASPLTQKIVIELQDLPVDVELYYQGVLIKTISAVSVA